MGRLTRLEIPITVSEAAYGAGDNVGGILQVNGATGRNRMGTIINLQLIDLQSVAADFDILFFDALPSGGTYTDNAALVLGAGDYAKFLGQIAVVSSDYDAVDATTDVAKLNPNYVIKCPSGTMWVLVKSVGTPDFAAGVALNLVFSIEHNG